MWLLLKHKCLLSVLLNSSVKFFFHPPCHNKFTSVLNCFVCPLRYFCLVSPSFYFGSHIFLSLSLSPPLSLPPLLPFLFIFPRSHGRLDFGLKLKSSIWVSNGELGFNRMWVKASSSNISSIQNWSCHL